MDTTKVVNVLNVLTFLFTLSTWLSRWHICTDSQGDWGWTATLEVAWANPSAQSEVNKSRLQRVMSSWVLSISRDGDIWATQAPSTTCSSVWPSLQKSFVITFKWNFLYFDLWPFPFSDHHWEEPVSIFFIPPIKYLYTLTTFALSLFFLRNPSSLDLCLYNRCSSHSITFVVFYCNMAMPLWCQGDQN